MGIPKRYLGRYFYHFTHIANISSIVEQGGLLSTNLKELYGIKHYNIANTNIQKRRGKMVVPTGPGGVVHDYVPFYFASTNPMLLGLLNRKVVDQPYICFIAISIERLLEDSVVFTDASANTAVPPSFYSDPDDLDELNWALIDSRRWGQDSEDEMHIRMAEVLVYQKAPLDWIDSYIVFNDIAGQEIRNCYRAAGIKKPAISGDWFNDRPFYFTKFFMEGRENETLVKGPIQLYEQYKDLVAAVIRNQEDDPPAPPRFEDIADALTVLENDFCAIPELEDIYDLRTDNPSHYETVGDHTMRVVNNVKDSFFFKTLGPKRKKAVRLAAYLHDIGKGPKEKWAGGVQNAYPDHPADAIPMLARILSEDFAQLSEKEIWWICLLVVYHDLMGDIISNGRDKAELFHLKLGAKELNMLAALTEADVRAISRGWSLGLADNLRSLINEALREGGED